MATESGVNVKITAVDPKKDTACFLADVSNTLQKRESVHGDPEIGLRATGKAITGMIEYHYGITLSHDIPPHLVAMFQGFFKMMRNAGDAYHEDNYTDQIGYAVLARRVDERRKP